MGGRGPKVSLEMGSILISGVRIWGQGGPQHT